ncbi:MAG: DUF814 domain-containing protein [Deltaproteobacteria bacterium]|nr:DUF814 domain-containing protein [Deltaproteobacteria bacterium]
MKAENLQVYEYCLAEGWKILAGKKDVDNDILSLKVARPEDWWFHVRGMPGSHVILQAPANNSADPGKERLHQAAAVAAWHSKARMGGVVAVTCCKAKFVGKPRGAKPGTVTVRKEILLKVRPGLPGAEIK